MRKNAISDVLDHYLYDLGRNADIKRASLEFFGRSIGDVVDGDLIADDDMDPVNMLFMEWLVFDFKLSNGKTPLSDFVKNNPLRLTDNELSDLRDMLDNEYGFFSVTSVKPGRIEVESLQQDKEYAVREYAGARLLLPGQTIICRVAKIGERYEFASGTCQMLDTMMTEQAKKYFRKSGDIITPQVVYEILYKPGRQQADEAENASDKIDLTMNEQKAEKQAEAAFNVCGISPFVSVSQVKKWINKTANDDLATFPISILMGLAHHDLKKDDMDLLVKASCDLSNYSPHKSLSGKCPHEMKGKVRPDRDQSTPRYISGIFSSEGWMDYAEKAMKATKQGKPGLAMESYDKGFQELLSSKTTDREIYRLFANKGSSMLAAGNPAGEELLHMALELNPHYDFAASQLDRLDKGEFNTNIINFLTKELPSFSDKLSVKAVDNLVDKFIAKQLRDDPGVIYFVWLMKLGINFAQTDFEPTRLFTSKMRH
ncbi:MAG: hypothetical protein WCT26_00140 [Candidatus Buchananbacteria bacterium]|jgi:hypothetical protein